MTVWIRHLNRFNQGRKMCKEKITQKEPPKDFIIEAFSKKVHSENHGVLMKLVQGLISWEQSKKKTNKHHLFHTSTLKV